MHGCRARTVPWGLKKPTDFCHSGAVDDGVPTDEGGTLKKTMYVCISGSKVMFDLVRGSFPRAQTDWWEIAGFLGWEEGRGTVVVAVRILHIDSVSVNCLRVRSNRTAFVWQPRVEIG